MGPPRQFDFSTSLGGGPVAHDSTSSPLTFTGLWTDDPFSQLRFRGGSDAESELAETPNEVVTMRWIGGEFLTGSGAAFTTESDPDIEHAFATLDWVSGP